MTTEDRAYEAAARVMVSEALPGISLDALPENLRSEIVASAKKVVTTFLTAMGQEVR